MKIKKLTLVGEFNKIYHYKVNPRGKEFINNYNHFEAWKKTYIGVNTNLKVNLINLWNEILISMIIG